MKRSTPIDPAKELLASLNEPAGLIGLVGTVNSGKGVVLAHLANNLALAGRRATYVNPTSASEVTAGINEFKKSDSDVFIMREFRDISDSAICELLDVSKSKLVVVGLHPNVELHIEKINLSDSDYGVSFQVFDLVRPDQLSSQVVGTA